MNRNQDEEKGNQNKGNSKKHFGIKDDDLVIESPPEGEKKEAKEESEENPQTLHVTILVFSSIWSTGKLLPCLLTQVSGVMIK